MEKAQTKIQILLPRVICMSFWYLSHHPLLPRATNQLPNPFFYQTKKNNNNVDGPHLQSHHRIDCVSLPLNNDSTYSIILLASSVTV
jgi:hypothetical protein